MSKFPPYATPLQKFNHYAVLIFCAAVFVFLIAPLLVLFPLSFNAEPYFTITKRMLSLDPDAFSLRWYRDIFHGGMIEPEATTGWWADMWENSAWVRATKNSFIIGFFATFIATVLGTLAAVGLSRPEIPFGRTIMSILILPIVVPLIVTASGMFYFYSLDFNPFLEGQQTLSHTKFGVILAHAAMGTPFVVITVTATMVGFDQSLMKAATSLGATPIWAFWKVKLPLIAPGVISGALFAFVTSFDEVVAVIFLASPADKTIPRQMWSGVREQISPTILAVASILVVLSILLLTTIELLRRRSERLRGLSPS